MMDDYMVMCDDSSTRLESLFEERGAFVDLVVTSPPYDTLRKYTEETPYTQDIQMKVIQGLHKCLKKGGVVVWVCADKVIDGSESGSSFVAAQQFMQSGFRLHDTMIWRKTNPMPRMKTKRYFDCWEYMFVFSKGQPKTFNPIMVPCKCGGMVYDSTCKNMGGENGRTHKTFNINNQRYKDNIWDIAVAQNKTGHPAVFPYKLAEDHILSWSNEGDTVLDPFCGSGTTGLAALNNKRKFVGIDISPEYCRMAFDRLTALAGGKY